MQRALYIFVYVVASSAAFVVYGTCHALLHLDRQQCAVLATCWHTPLVKMPSTLPYILPPSPFQDEMMARMREILQVGERAADGAVPCKGQTGRTSVGRDRMPCWLGLPAGVTCLHF